MAIEARLDLHGLRQHEAHEALRSFILRCRTDGLRLVLVITGKGRRSGRAAAADHIYVTQQVHGVLRQQVPQWLAEPAFAPHIVSVAQAHPRHGGEGALYIHLRRK